MSVPAASPAPDHTRDALRRLATQLLAKLKARRLKRNLEQERTRALAEPNGG